MQSLPVSLASSGDNILIAADPSGRAIVVLGFFLLATAPVTLQFFSDTAVPVALTGPMPANANCTLTALPGNSLDVPQLMKTVPGKALNLRLGASVAVGGFLLFDLV